MYTWSSVATRMTVVLASVVAGFGQGTNSGRDGVQRVGNENRTSRVNASNTGVRVSPGESVGFSMGKFPAMTNEQKLYKSLSTDDADTTMRKIETKEIDINAKNPEGSSVAYMAIVSGHTNVIKFMLDHELDLFTDSDGSHPIYDAANFGQVDILKILLEMPKYAGSIRLEGVRDYIQYRIGFMRSNPGQYPMKLEDLQAVLHILETKITGHFVPDYKPSQFKDGL